MIIKSKVFITKHLDINSIFKENIQEFLASEFYLLAFMTIDKSGNKLLGGWGGGLCLRGPLDLRGSIQSGFSTCLVDMALLDVDLPGFLPPGLDSWVYTYAEEKHVWQQNLVDQAFDRLFQMAYAVQDLDKKKSVSLAIQIDTKVCSITNKGWPF